MFLLKQELSVKVADINDVQVNLKMRIIIIKKKLHESKKEKTNTTVL